MTATEAPTRRIVFNTMRVASVQRLCDDAVAVTFDVPDELAADYAFLPGQSLTLRRNVDGRDERRSYSICAPAGSPPRIGVREVPDGLFSTWLVREVRPGDRIEVSTPTGSFTPVQERAGHHVFIAAGSGITPVLSIASSVLRDPETTATVLCGNRRADTVMFVDELADLKDRYPERLNLVHVLSREAREVELFTGRLDAVKLSALLDWLPPPETVSQWWLCGPFGMISDARQVLTQRGVPAERVHLELFYVEDVAPEPRRRIEPDVGGATSEVTVLLDGRASTMSLSREVAVLDGAQRSRPDLPFACKGGVCGTCRARVVDGEVHMRRNFALEQSEMDAGFVLTCQALPISERVTVDYDS